MLTVRSCRRAIIALLCSLAVTACSDSGVITSSPSYQPAQTSDGSAPVAADATIDPRAQPAVKAFLAFSAAANAAAMRPTAPGESYPPEANYTQYSFDPARLETSEYVWSLKRAGVALRGTPPSHSITVTAVELQGGSYPSVTLTDCAALSPTWRPASVSTGKPVPTRPPDGAAAKPPYLVTYTVIFYKEHWGVQKQVIDTTSTCTPQS
jgi:hypothetical protein